jgi:hypothetical protein
MIYSYLEKHCRYHLKATVNMGGSSREKLKKSNISANLILDVYYTLPQGRQEN